MSTKNIFLTLLLLSPLGSCKKNPVDRLTNPNPDGAVPQNSGIYIIYDDELKTGGGLGLIPGGENQTIDLSDISEPRRSSLQIRYQWNGGDTPAQHLFAGYSFSVTPDLSTLSSATGKDLSASGYTKMTFFLRGELSEGNTLRIEGPSDGNSTTVPARMELGPSGVTSDWHAYTLSVPASFFSNVKVFATISIQYAQAPRTTNPGQGGTIYIDNIMYER